MSYLRYCLRIINITLLHAYLEEKARQKEGSDTVHMYTHMHTPPAALDQPGASISDLIAMALNFIATHSNTYKKNML